MVNVKKRITTALFIFALCTALSLAGFAYTLNLYRGTTLSDSKTAEAGSYVTIEELTVSGGKYLLGWNTLDGSKLYGYRLQLNSDMNLYALERECMAPVPGKNFFDNPGFNEDYFDIRPSNGNVSFITEDDGNRALLYHRGSGYASIQKYVKWEAGRKYRVAARIKSTETITVHHNPRYLSTTETSGAGNHASAGVTVTAGVWYNYEGTIKIPDNYVESNSSALSFYGDPGKTISNNDMMYDDLVLIPYYKISFDLNGGMGSVPSDDYTLASTYNIVSTSTPSKAGCSFKGWAPSPTADKAVTAVALDGNDITLYAVWNDLSTADALTYEPSTTRRGVADGIVNLSCYGTRAGYTEAKLYFADDTDILDGYTVLADLTVTNGAASYMMTGNRAIPKEATRICAILSGGGLTDTAVYCNIPEANRMDKTEKPLYSFYAISDLHLGNDYWPEMTVNRNNAVADITAVKPDFVAISGDLIDRGVTSYFNSLYPFLENNFNSKNIPAFILCGNHEFFDLNYSTKGYDLPELLNAYSSQQAILEQNPDISISRSDNSLFYSASFKGCKLIFLAVPTPISDTAVTYNVTDEQILWLDEQLYDGEKSNKTVFVFTHVGLSGYVPKAGSPGETCSGISNTATVSKVLDRHPNTVIISGHTHSFLDSDSFFTSVGDMKTTFTHLNDGCAVWLSPDDGATYFKDYSMGQYIEVYSDKILIKARQFTSPAKFISKGLYIAEIPNSDKTLGAASIEGTTAAGSVLHAKLNGENVPSDCKCEWSVGAKVVGTGTDYTVVADSSFGGHHIALRITMPDETYVSCLSEGTFEGYNIHYDANGGTGTVPADCISMDGADYEPIKYTGFPKMNGKYFIGWSTDRTATLPLVSVSIDSDTTLYAVYTDKPAFYFDANLSGWVPNGALASSEIENGILKSVSSATNGDAFYTLSSASIDAEKYRYLRLKMSLVKGNTDCLYFATADQGFNVNKTRIPFTDNYIVSRANGINIYEFDIPTIETAKNFWNGTVSSLRYDIIGTLNGEALTDYMVFSDKRGIYSAAVEVPSPVDGQALSKTATLSQGSSKCSVASVIWDTDKAAVGGKKYTASITLSPTDGFEFTTKEDIFSNFTINGCKPCDVVFNVDGSVTISAELTAMLSTTVGDISGGTTTVTVDFGQKIDNALVVIALYSADGKSFIDCRFCTDFSSSDGKLIVNAGSLDKAGLVRAYVFDNLLSLRPEGNCVFASLE